jgi:hypothetical protein
MTNSNPPKKRSRRKPTQPEAERTVKEVPHPPTEKPVLKVEEPVPNKYAPKPKVGTPSLGRSPNYVTSVGLGKLKVTTANGNTEL